MLTQPRQVYRLPRRTEHAQVGEKSGEWCARRYRDNRQGRVLAGVGSKRQRTDGVAPLAPQLEDQAGHAHQRIQQRQSDETGPPSPKAQPYGQRARGRSAARQGHRPPGARPPPPPRPSNHGSTAPYEQGVAEGTQAVRGQDRCRRKQQARTCEAKHVVAGPLDPSLRHRLPYGPCGQPNAVKRLAQAKQNGGQHELQRESTQRIPRRRARPEHMRRAQLATPPMQHCCRSQAGGRQRPMREMPRRSGGVAETSTDRPVSAPSQAMGARVCAAALRFRTSSIGAIV